MFPFAAKNNLQARISFQKCSLSITTAKFIAYKVGEETHLRCLHCSQDDYHTLRELLREYFAYWNIGYSECEL